MTIAQQLRQIRADFADWEKGNSGVVDIVSDLGYLFTQLRETPAGPAAYVMFHREEKRGSYEEQGAVDRFFWVVIARGKGLEVDPGSSLVKGVAGGKPMFNLVEEGRETCRRLTFDADTTEGSVDYRGTEPLDLNGAVLTDVMRIEFSIGCQLPAVNKNLPPDAPDSETGS